MTIVARILMILIFLAAPALAETRIALVIGNSAYQHAPALANPKNDAEGMAVALQRVKFDVLAGTDLDKPAMEKLLQAFAAKLDTADVALVYYAGHGLQVQGRNYIVPAAPVSAVRSCSRNRPPPSRSRSGNPIRGTTAHGRAARRVRPGRRLS